MRLYESDEDEAKRGSIPSIEVYVEQIEAQLASAQKREENLREWFHSAQAVIDAAQKMVVAFRTGSTWEQAVKLFDAVLAAHLERYPTGSENGGTR